MQYVALLISMVLTVLGQVLMKLGGSAATGDRAGLIGLVISYATSPYIVLGFGLSAVAAFFYTYSLAKLDYSFVSLSSSFQYVLVLLVSMLFFREVIGVSRWIGTGFILIGLFFVLRS